MDFSWVGSRVVSLSCDEHLLSLTWWNDDFILDGFCTHDVFLTRSALLAIMVVSDIQTMELFKETIKRYLWLDIG